ncbi:MAG: hypothetical protein R3D55_01295 [Chloroflexota bacterium]
MSCCSRGKKRSKSTWTRAWWITCWTSVRATCPGEGALPQLTPYIATGASPRAGIFLVQAAKAYAFLQNRSYVLPDDIKALAPDILRHRLLTTFEAEAEGITPDQLIQQLLDSILVP